MSMRGSRRCGRKLALSGRSFAWDRAVVATLRHSTLPWDEELVAAPLADARDLGKRDRLSLVAQFAAHEALLQFAGLADADVEPAEWAVVQKRGIDVRLLRVAARAVDASVAPPVLTLVQQFAELVGADLDVLRQSWARADAVYAEAHARLMRGAAADLRWMRRSAAGAIAAPGPEGLRTLFDQAATFAYDGEDAIRTLQQFSERVIVLRGASPLARYSALGSLIGDKSLDPAVAAQRILEDTSHARHVFVVSAREAFDAASREVVERLVAARHGTWLMPDDGEPLPPMRWFVVSPLLAARHALESRIESADWLDAFVDSDGFSAYLTDGVVPPPKAVLPSLTEPARSYIGALAFLGNRIPCDVASRFLEQFLFHGELAELVFDGVTAVDGNEFVIATEAVASLIPEASRAGIARVAAPHACGVRAAMLWLEAGDSANASAALDRTEWTSAAEIVSDLRAIPISVLSRATLRTYAHALIDCGRYHDARDVAALVDGDDRELILARAERRTGDYAPALARLERMATRTLDSELLRGEILRVLERYGDAANALGGCSATNDEDAIRLAYERAVLAYDAHGDVDRSWMRPHYLSARFSTYLALESRDYDEAAEHAIESHALARCTSERIDATLDRVFAIFSAGKWDEARIVALEALHEVEETQGDRAAGGILFTLAYLAADDAQWAHASQRIARLRHYYSGTHDDLHLTELQLLTAHLDFSRGRFADAQRAAATAYAATHGQIREAAALILDELEPTAPLRSTGRSGNAELARRHGRIRNPAAHQPTESIPDQLFAFRRALAAGDRTTAQTIAARLDLVLDSAPAPSDIELRVLRAAATQDFPFSDADFDIAWSFATRNRLGQWHSIGPFKPDAFEASTPDWITCSERELLYFDGSSRWSGEGREAVGALFRTRAENHRLRRVLDQDETVRPMHAGAIDGIVGESPQIREVCSLVTRIARRDVPACILGESGTGKELVARAIHRHSPRRAKPFTAVNCAALPENLIESELFGHVRGAFTGADRDRAGLIETTDGGTLFLDEIGELPLGAQAKLLRFLQEGEFRRVGETASRTADVRIVSATNRKLESAVERGRFRDDLYYRVRGVEIVMPPLRDRGADVQLLAAHFLGAEREKHRGGASALAADVESIFAAYAWPGNVRELQNTIRAAHAMAGDARQIELDHLPARLRSVVPPRVASGSYHDAVSRFRRDLIERSLLEARGNQNKAAAMLKISRQALSYQIRELGVMVSR